MCLLRQVEFLPDRQQQRHRGVSPGMGKQSPRKSIHSDGIEGIRLITIHKSKGLEYDHVIMPYCDWQLEKANTIWCTPQEAPYNELPLVPVDFSAKQMKGSIYEDDYHHEHLQNIVDNLNLLYVAFTRASHNLYVFGKRASTAYRSGIIENHWKLLLRS